MAKTITHFSHPRHQLLLTYQACNFTCDLCETGGSGLRYRCNTCDFDLHESCTTFPRTLTFFAHPWDTLILADHGASTMKSYSCDLCLEPVKGFWYKCEPCNFDLHPHCSLASRIVCARSHPDHLLILAPVTAGSCSACRKNLTVWTYRCKMCSVNFHYKCLFTSPVGAEAVNK